VPRLARDKRGLTRWEELVRERAERRGSAPGRSRVVPASVLPMQKSARDLSQSAGQLAGGSGGRSDRSFRQSRCGDATRRFQASYRSTAARGALPGPPDTVLPFDFACLTEAFRNPNTDHIADVGPVQWVAPEGVLQGRGCSADRKRPPVGRVSSIVRELFPPARRTSPRACAAGRQFPAGVRAA